MESANSASGDPQVRVDTATPSHSLQSDQSFRDRFENFLPMIQEYWPGVPWDTLEATRGSLDEVVRVIAQHSGLSTKGVHEQLDQLINVAGDRTRGLAESLEPLEKQLEQLLDELNSTLRPRIEHPVRQRPLLAIAIAAGIGVLIGSILSGGRRSS